MHFKHPSHLAGSDKCVCVRGASVLLTFALLGVAGSVASAQSLTGLGFLYSDTGGYSMADGISRDGSTVVGVAGVSPGEELAVRWTRGGGLQRLSSPYGYSRAFAANQDGSVIVGRSDAPGEDTRPAVWTDGGVTYLPPLNDAFWSVANGVSGDGSVVAGSVGSGPAFRWTSAEGTIDLGVLHGGIWADGLGVSGDGSVIVGRGNTDEPGGAFRWTSGEGMVNIGVYPGATHSSAHAADNDGSVIVGWAGGAGVAHAFRWTSAGGMEDLGVLPLSTSSHALGVNGDGSVVVGDLYLFVTEPVYRAFFWNRQLGMVDLNTYLPTLGIDLTGWTLENAVGVSADGLTITGNGLHNGRSEGWVVTLPSCPADFNGDVLLNSQDFFDFLSAYFDGAPTADFNQDGVVSSEDFFDFLAGFFAGCP
jgi:probable HAF family extracellular repeat protein